MVEHYNDGNRHDGNRFHPLHNDDHYCDINLLQCSDKLLDNLGDEHSLLDINVNDLNNGDPNIHLRLSNCHNHKHERFIRSNNNLLTDGDFNLNHYINQLHDINYDINNHDDEHSLDYNCGSSALHNRISCIRF